MNALHERCARTLQAQGRLTGWMPCLAWPCPCREALQQGTAALAAGIAAKSPLTAAGIKRVLLHQR